MASSSPRAKQNTNVRWRGLAQFVSSQEDSIQEDAIALCCEECLAGQELCVAGSCGRIHPLTLAQSPPTVSPCPPARSPPPLPRFPVSLPRVLRMRWGAVPAWLEEAGASCRISCPLSMDANLHSGRLLMEYHRSCVTVFSHRRSEF